MEEGERNMPNEAQKSAIKKVRFGAFLSYQVFFSNNYTSVQVGSEFIYNKVPEVIHKT